VQTVTLAFNSFNTEDGYDFVYIYNGYSNNSNSLIGELTGFYYYYTTQTTQPWMFIEFTSDPIIPGPGFYATYWSTTGEQFLNLVLNLKYTFNGKHRVYLQFKPNF